VHPEAVLLMSALPLMCRVGSVMAGDPLVAASWWQVPQG
jgi:hypothetical protein